MWWSQFLVALVLWFSITALWSTMLMQIRNAWTYKQVSKHTAEVYTRCVEMINSGEYNLQKIERMYECLASYDKILRRFWVWDITKFVTDAEAYRWIHQGDSNAH